MAPRKHPLCPNGIVCVAFIDFIRGGAGVWALWYHRHIALGPYHIQHALHSVSMAIQTHCVVVIVGTHVLVFMACQVHRVMFKGSLCLQTNFAHQFLR